MSRKHAARLTKDTALVYAGYMLRYLSVIILLPYYSHVLGPSSYGIVLASMALMNFVLMSVNYGFSVTGARELASSGADASLRSEILTRQLIGRLCLVPVGLAIGSIGFLGSSILHNNPICTAFGVMLGLLQAFNLGWFFQGLRRFKTSIIIEAVNYPLNIAFVAVLVHTPHDESLVLLSLCLSTAISTAIAYAVALRGTAIKRANLMSGIQEIVRSTSVFLPGVNALVMTSGSTYLLSTLSDSANVGYFGTSERILALSASFLSPLAQVFMPSIISTSSSETRSNSRLASTVVCVEVFYGIMAALVGVVLAPIAIPFVLGLQFVPATHILRILLLALPLAATTHAIYYYIMIPRRCERVITISTTASTLVAVALGFLLTYRYGGVGLAWARVIGEGSALLLIIILGVKAGLRRDLVGPLVVVATGFSQLVARIRSPRQA